MNGHLYKTEMIFEEPGGASCSHWELKPPLLLKTPSDEHEDACTQTDGTKKAERICYLPSHDFLLPEEEQELPVITVCHTQNLASPIARKKTSQIHKNKTPNTVKEMMEKHRENERLRHHSLNEHLRLICKKVPGSKEDGKETKVVMMQRIIAYIAYLENTVRHMSSSLETDVDPRLLLLTSNVDDMEKSGTWTREFRTYSSDDSKDSESTNLSLKRRLKLSSPTIDSTTDSAASFSDFRAQTFCGYSLDKDSQDSTVPSSSYSVEVPDGLDSYDFLQPAEEVVIGDTATSDPFLSDSQYDSGVFELQSSKLDNVMSSPEEIKWLGSPDFMQSQIKQDVGIICDQSPLDDQHSEMINSFIVSPDNILPQSSSLLENVEQMVPEQPVSGFHNQISVILPPRSKKRKQMSPRRVPLINVTNFQDLLEVSQREAGMPELIVCNDKHQIGLPYFVGNFEEVESTNACSASSHINEPVKHSEFIQATHSIVRESSIQSSAKLDLRKSSWMNGFMMYSRIHRKQFIRENPGVHTASISKMMGQSWRSMTATQQEPYKEQARICSQELHKLLDEHRKV